MSTDREKSLAEYDRTMARQDDITHRKCIIPGCGHLILIIGPSTREICVWCQRTEQP